MRPESSTCCRLTTGRGLIDADGMNKWLLGLVAAYADPLETFKNTILYYFILPLRIGMVQAVTPMSWGIALTPTVIAIYVLIVGLIATMLGRSFGWQAGLAMIVAGTLFFFGFSNFPWPAFIAAGGDAGLALRRARRRSVFAAVLPVHPGVGLVAAFHADGLSVRPRGVLVSADRRG